MSTIDGWADLARMREREALAERDRLVGTTAHGLDVQAAWQRAQLWSYVRDHEGPQGVQYGTERAAVWLREGSEAQRRAALVWLDEAREHLSPSDLLDALLADVA